MKLLLGVVGLVVLIGYLITVAIAGYEGISYEFGKGWAIGAIVLALGRFAFPLGVGAFLGAWKVWGWHWFPALVLGVPGVLLFIPGILMTIVRVFRKKE
ncbi:hypothetical protein [Bordetella sp. 02P26C-1]|uniref:hypothetical protein n=1 Tax=Bordetella sp. 02P26C-1 TaxID=2683195 RepID=UPI001355D1E8|nr:hypothetical protein [Bordetella sp. 02P26C-1]MVW79754.1 hypothetical protein [Bordetella sp. 02P26C-1]